MMADPAALTAEAIAQVSKAQEGPEAQGPALATRSNIPEDIEEDANQDAISIKTTTEDLFQQTVRSTSPGPEARQHNLGLDIKYPWGWSGSNYDDYDVITVHGVRDDYKNCWTDKNGAWWVKDQLFEQLSVRQVDFSYEIEEGSTLYEPNGITLLAQQLIAEYAAVRKNLEDTEIDRPIIWICHDLGGTIVKEALSIALANPAKYGKVPILTSAIIFLGTPHRFQSASDLEDQMHKLILLPGPEIRNKVVSKVRNFARQVDSINQAFLATKLLSRAMIFNVFVQNIHHSINRKSTDGTNPPVILDVDPEEENANPITPFPRYAHFIGHPFEAAGRIRWTVVDHEDLVKGDLENWWLPVLSNNFNVTGWPLQVNYRIINYQSRLLALSPPNRSLDTPFDPVLPKPAVVSWIYQQKAYVNFFRLGAGPRLLHLHGNGNRHANISEISRLFYVEHDSFSAITFSNRTVERTVIYYEFDRWDSRYNTISSMLVYLINTLAWRFWATCSGIMLEELRFLDDTCAWTIEDLYHLYTLIKERNPTTRLTIFVSCFDQCPKADRQWFLERVLQTQSCCDLEHRIIFSTSWPDDLPASSLPTGSRINLDDCPAFEGSRTAVLEELGSSLDLLVAQRPIYEHFRPQLEALMEQCGDTPYLGRILLTWLGTHHRGRPRSDIAETIKMMSPPTATTVVQAIVSSFPSELRLRLENVFNWVKHASEPWSPESLAEALTVYELRNDQPSLHDLDAQSMIEEIEEAFGGIITVRNRDVKFSHPSFYDVPEVGVEGTGEERAAMVNGIIAETCLRYLQLDSAQDALSMFSLDNLAGGPWWTLLDAVLISHPRTSMAEYATRFWPAHYKASGRFRPKDLVRQLFTARETRASWERVFWLLSNPFTRLHRSYVSTLPVFAMLGLEDLVEEQAKSEKGKPTCEKDCWLAITEAARAGNEKIVQRLLDQVNVDEKQLQTALFWAAACGNSRISNVLANKIPKLEMFQWPSDIMFRAAACGLGDLLAAIVLSGHDINELSTYWRAPLAVILAWRNQVSATELLLNLEPKPDLTLRDGDGDDAIITATKKGNPRMIKLLLEAGASIETKNSGGQGLLRIAIDETVHKVLEVLLREGAEFKATDDNEDGILGIAADNGSLECIRILLDHKADPNVEYDGETALYKAVVGNYAEVAQLLLQHEPKPEMDVVPEGRLTLLMRAVSNKNTEMASLLIKHGAKVDALDPNGGACKTPLSAACYEGDLTMVKLLLENGADVNYTGSESDSPLFTALYEKQLAVAKYLLEDENVDVMWATHDGMGCLHATFNNADLIPLVLKRGIPIDNQCAYGTTLHMAAFYNHPKSIDALVRSDPKPTIDCVYHDDGVLTDKVGYTPLQMAVTHANPECVELLLKNGASPSFRNKNDDDAIDILLQSETNAKGAEQCLRWMLSEPYKIPVDQVDREGKTRLHHIQATTPESVVRLLVEAKAPLDVPDRDGFTPLALAVSKGNEDVAKYLIKQGARPNGFGPSFGSILHLAVKHCTVELVKSLVDSGADLEMVDPEYGESLLYTAIDIESKDRLKMVRYLIDEARAPINKPGGELGYPIIRAVRLIKDDFGTGVKILKFLIRRQADLNVSDSQGRRAVHFACSLWDDLAVKALVAAGAEVNAKDKFGRMPIHFAASNRNQSCVSYLLHNMQDVDINLTDYDNWTPLMWAARMGSERVITTITERNPDLWVRGRAYTGRAEWSALKLLNFSQQDASSIVSLEPKERTRVNADGETEVWDDDFHKIRLGAWKSAYCNSCLSQILGIQWRCIECSQDFSLCFKCYGRRNDMHDPEHSFEEIEPLYSTMLMPSRPASPSSDNQAHESPQASGGDKVDGNPQVVVDSADAEPNPAESVVEEEFDPDGEFDPENFDLEADTEG